MKRTRCLLQTIGTVLCFVSCTAQHELGQNTPFRDACALVPGPAHEGGAVVIALADDVDASHAPVPQNGSERLLFRHLYETLLRVDCSGRVVPDLALSWESQDGGRAWTFTLRQGVRFWDGTSMTASDVVASWRSRAPSPTMRSGLPWEGPEAATALDDAHLRVVLTEARSQVPREFAHLSWSVTGERDFSGWPLGSGPHRPSGPAAEAGPEGARRVVTAYPVSSASWTVLRFLLATGETARHLLDEPVDLMITESISLEEVNAWPEFTGHLLPWDKTYVVASPSPGGLTALRSTLPASRRDALARDVLRGAARGAGPPDWWRASTHCGLAYTARMPPTPEPRVVFEANDVHGRALAERLVALSAEPLQAVARTSAGFAADLHDAGAHMYVFALPSQAGSPCSVLQSLARRAPWLLHGRMSRSGNGENQALQTHLLPLVETRPMLVTRQGLVGIDLGAHGTLQLDRIGWSRDGDSP